MAKGAGMDAMAMLLKAVEGGLGGLNASRQQGKEDQRARQQMLGQQVGLALNVLNSERSAKMAQDQHKLQLKRFDAITKHNENMQEIGRQENLQRQQQATLTQQWRQEQIRDTNERRDETRRYNDRRLALLGQPKAPTGDLAMYNKYIADGMSPEQAADRLHPLKTAKPVMTLAEAKSLALGYIGPRSANESPESHARRFNTTAANIMAGSTTPVVARPDYDFKREAEVEGRMLDSILGLARAPKVDKKGKPITGLETFYDEMMKPNPKGFMEFGVNSKENQGRDKTFVSTLRRLVEVRDDMESKGIDLRYTRPIRFFGRARVKQQFREYIDRMSNVKDPQDRPLKIEAIKLYKELSGDQGDPVDWGETARAMGTAATLDNRTAEIDTGAGKLLSKMSGNTGSGSDADRRLLLQGLGWAVR